MSLFAPSTASRPDDATAFDRNLRVLAHRSKRELVEVVVRTFQRVEGAARLLPGEPPLREFVWTVSRRYHANPYHNFHHAVDTTNTMGWLLTRRVLRTHLPDLHAFVLLLAALIHDLDHPGTDNQYEVKTGSDRARKYDNQGVLEHHSVEQARALLTREHAGLLDGMPAPLHRPALELLDAAVMATDFSRHQAFLERLSHRLERGPIDWSQPDDLNLIACTLIKAADIGNTAKHFPECRRWGRRIMREYWEQGRLEKLHKLPLGPLNDRDTTDFYPAQARFVRQQAAPLFELLARLEPGAQEMVEAAHRNHREYARHAGQASRAS